jgi:hypothetical protein
MTYNNTTAALMDGVAPAVFTAIDHGYVSWTFDPRDANGTLLLSAAGAAGVLTVVGVKMNTRVVNNIVVEVSTAGATLTANQCLAGVYQNGVLLGTTADQSTVWNSTGVKTMALANTPTVEQGLVYVAFVYNGTTAPTFVAQSASTAVSSVAAINNGLVRQGSGGSAITTALPASLPTITASNTAAHPWVALS